jgi:hypothetical protein
MLLKTQPFLHCHILQVIKIISSRAPTMFSCLFSLIVALWRQRIWGEISPIEGQQDFAKLHLRKRWYDVSILWRIQFSQEKESRCICLLLNQSWVFSLSYRSSKKNTLRLGWHLNFHTNLRIGCVGKVPDRALEAFFDGISSCPPPPNVGPYMILLSLWQISMVLGQRHVLLIGHFWYGCVKNIIEMILPWSLCYRDIVSDDIGVEFRWLHLSDFTILHIKPERGWCTILNLNWRNTFELCQEFQ